MRILSVLIVILLLFSCKKAEERECMKAAGDQTKLEIPLESFSNLHVGAKMEVHLIQGSENKIVIHGRENLIHLIKHDINEGKLHLTNENRCDFLRKYSKNDVKVEVHFVHLSEIFFEGTKDLTTASPINTSSMKLTIQDGGATVYLNVNCQNLNIVQGHGYGDFVVSGTCNHAILKMTSNGFGDSQNLTVTDELYVINSSPVSSSINVDGAKTTVEINGSGNVKYIGVPQTLTFNQFGTGELINGN